MEAVPGIIGSGGSGHNPLPNPLPNGPNGPNDPGNIVPVSDSTEREKKHYATLVPEPTGL